MMPAIVAPTFGVRSRIPAILARVRPERLERAAPAGDEAAEPALPDLVEDLRDVAAERLHRAADRLHDHRQLVRIEIESSSVERPVRDRPELVGMSDGSRAAEDLAPQEHRVGHRHTDPDAVRGELERPACGESVGDVTRRSAACSRESCSW